MKLNIRLFTTILAISLIIGNCAFADTKIAVVDVPALVASSPQVKALKEEQAKKLQDLEKWLEIVNADIAKQSTEENKKKLNDKYSADLIKRKENIAKEYKKKLENIDASITATINAEAKARGYNVVLTKSTVLYGGVDITESLKKVVK